MRRRSSWDDDDRRRGPKPVAGALDELATRLGVPRTGVAGPVFEQWERIVGTVVAGHAQPVRLRSGVLTVEVDDPAWATQLRFLTADIVGRIEAAVGAGEVREVRVVVSGAAAGGRPGDRGRPGG